MLAVYRVVPLKVPSSFSSFSPLSRFCRFLSYIQKIRGAREVAPDPLFKMKASEITISFDETRYLADVGAFFLSFVQLPRESPGASCFFPIPVVRSSR